MTDAFLNKFAAKFKGWMQPIKRMQAIDRVKRMKAAPKPKKIPGDFEDFKGKALRAGGWALLGGGGAAYGIHKATKHNEPQYQPSPHMGGGGTM